MQRRHPRQQALLKRNWIQRGKDAFECVVRRQAVLQVDELGQPISMYAGEMGDLLPRIGAADDATEGDDDQIDQRMLDASQSTPWFGQPDEKPFDGNWGKRWRL
jgi:hypothetical protein